MRKIFLIAATVLALGCAPAYAPVAADPGRVDINVMYRDLAPYGHWIHRATYGWVWAPYGVPLDWRPYTYGHWAYTDDYGWLWVSDWAWGWAPFHYGRWTYDDDYGWVWIPGSVWAPAWVAWRYGDDWVGWAPLPPAAVWRPGVGFTVSFGVIDRHLRPSTWVFVRERDFVRPNLAHYAQFPARNVVILHRTRNATHYGFHHDRIINRGIDLGRVERVIGRPVVRHRVHDVDSARAWREHRATSGQVRLFRPRVIERAHGVRPPPPAAVREYRVPREMHRPEDVQRRELQQRQRQEQRRMEDRYRRELRDRPRAASERLRDQRREEMRELQREHRRQDMLLRHRISRERSGAFHAPREQQQQRRPQGQSRERNGAFHAPREQQRRRPQRQSRDRNERHDTH